MNKNYYKLTRILESADLSVPIGAVIEVKKVYLNKIDFKIISVPENIPGGAEMVGFETNVTLVELF